MINLSLRTLMCTYSLANIMCQWYKHFVRTILTRNKNLTCLGLWYPLSNATEWWTKWINVNEMCKMRICANERNFCVCVHSLLYILLLTITSNKLLWMEYFVLDFLFCNTSLKSKYSFVEKWLICIRYLCPILRSNIYLWRKNWNLSAL